MFMDLAFLKVILLTKPPSVTYRMPYLPSCSSTRYDFWPMSSLHSTMVGTQSWNLLVLSCSPPSWSSWPERKMQWPFVDAVTVSIREVASAWRTGTGFFRRLWISIQYMVQFFPHSESTGPRISRWKREQFHSLSPLETQQSYFLPVPTALSSTDLKVLITKQRALWPGTTTNIPLTWKPAYPWPP